MSTPLDFRFGRAVLRVGAVVCAALLAWTGPAFAGPVQARTRPAAASAQWQLAALGAPDAWRYSTGVGVTVAVLDSGVDASHPDLAGRVLPGADFVDGSGNGWQDPVGHGTAVAAFIAGHAAGTAGVTGLAPGARILPVRVLDARNRYDDPAVVAEGLRWAVDHGADIVNMSLGGATRSDALAAAISYAALHDVVVVACTGNVSADSPTGEVWYPAREPGVVAVAGLEGGPTVQRRAARSAPAGKGGSGAGSTDVLWSGSLTGPQTMLTAPATNLVGARPGGYWPVQGTSFAAPMVAAAAALVRSRWPDLSADHVTQRLIRTARDLGPAGRDDRYGYGEVDPPAALGIDAASTKAEPAEQDTATAAGESTIGPTQRLVFGGWIALVSVIALVWTGLAVHQRRAR